MICSRSFVPLQRTGHCPQSGTLDPSSAGFLFSVNLYPLPPIVYGVKPYLFGVNAPWTLRRFLVLHRRAIMVGMQAVLDQFGMHCGSRHAEPMGCFGLVSFGKLDGL